MELGDSPTKHKHDHSSSEEEIKEDLSVFGLGVSGKSTEASSIIGLGKKREEDPSKTNFQKHQKKLRAEMQMAYRTGDKSTYERLKERLGPDA